MSFTDVLSMTRFLLGYGFLVFTIPQILVVTVLAVVVELIPILRKNHTVKRWTLVATVSLAFVGNFLLQAGVLSDISTARYVIGSSYPDFDIEFDKYEIRTKRMWIATIIPPPMRHQICSTDENSFCSLLAPDGTPEFMNEVPEGVFAYLYLLLLSGGPPAIVNYMVMNHIFGPWRKQKRKSKDDLMAQPG